MLSLRANTCEKIILTDNDSKNIVTISPTWRDGHINLNFDAPHAVQISRVENDGTENQRKS